MPYLLNLESYKGPIEKLLELVEEKKLEITLVNLSKVTDDFLIYFENLQKEELEKDSESKANLKIILADFLVVATKLLLIKSKVLVPSLSLSEEEESDIKDLESRLKLYQELKPMKKYIASLWQEAPYMFTREFLMTKEPVFYPPETITTTHLLKAISKIIGELEKVLMPQKHIKQEVISLKAKIEEVLEKISNQTSTLDALHGKRTRRELVVLFLAVLHLIKNQLIYVEQEDSFGKITIAKLRQES